jgi:hypothetical protein
MSKVSILLDALLPNRAWIRRVHDPSHAAGRVTYWAIRAGLGVLVLLLIYFFNVSQHQALQ